MKIELIVSSEMSANRTQTSGNYPKRNKLYLEHGESLKTKISGIFRIFFFNGTTDNRSGVQMCRSKNFRKFPFFFLI